MKLLWILIVIAFFSSTVLAQTIVKESEVPEVVQASLKEKFHDVKVISWVLDEGNYGAIGKAEGKKVEYLFDADGKYISTKTKVKKEEVPSVVLLGVQASQYADWKFKNIEFVETAGHKSFYQIALNKDGQTQDLVFDSKGNEISK